MRSDDAISPPVAVRGLPPVPSMRFSTKVSAVSVWMEYVVVSQTKFRVLSVKKEGYLRTKYSDYNALPKRVKVSDLLLEPSSRGPFLDISPCVEGADPGKYPSSMHGPINLFALLRQPRCATVKPIVAAPTACSSSPTASPSAWAGNARCHRSTRSSRSARPYCASAWRKWPGMAPPSQRKIAALLLRTHNLRCQCSRSPST